MSLDIDGFFSPEADQFRAEMRATAPFRDWFDYALDLNRMGFDLVRGASTPSTDTRLFTMQVNFVRVHRAFQSALLLLERGSITDARTIMRSAVESVIALHALGNMDPNFLDQMIDAHYMNKRKVARILLNEPRYAATYTSAQIVKLKAAVDEAEAREIASGKKLMDINWSAVAAKHCPDLYELLYRRFSSDGTHATIDSLDWFVVADASMQITAFKLAPDAEGLIETISAACLVLIWAVEPFASAHDRADVTSQLSEQLKQFARLPDAFPGGDAA